MLLRIYLFLFYLSHLFVLLRNYCFSMKERNDKSFRNIWTSDTTNTWQYYLTKPHLLRSDYWKRGIYFHKTKNVFGKNFLFDLSLFLDNGWMWWDLYFCLLLVAVAQLVEVLCYKPAGRGFDSPIVIEIFHWNNPSGFTMALVLNHPLTEMSIRNISWGVKAAGA